MEISDWGSLNEIKNRSKKLGVKPFIVRGRKSYDICGAKEIIDSLGGVHFSEYQTNPHIEDIESAIKQFRESGCDFIIGVGGGTAMDIAKAVSILAPLDGSPTDYFTKILELKPRTIPLVLIPTTSGTGSEATQFAVVYIGKTKHSLAHNSLIPDVAIVDPALTSSLSPYMTACTGMDALSQAVEAFWSIHSTDESKEYSRQAIPLIMNNLSNAVNQNNEEARAAMATASNLAGKAINIAKTTAAHAVSYPMTSYFGVPHGLACGLTLPHFVLFNSQSGELNEARGQGYVMSVMGEIVQLVGAATPELARDRILSLMKDCGLPTTLGDAGVDDLEVVVEHGFNPERVVNNPRVLTQENLRMMLNSIFYS